MTAEGYILDNPVSESLKYDLGELVVRSSTIPFPSQWSMTCVGEGPYPLQLSQALKYCLWQLRAISLTIPCRNRWNMTWDSCWSCPLPFRVQINEIWPMLAKGHILYSSSSQACSWTAEGHILDNSVSKSLMCDLEQLGAISSSIRVQINERWPVSAESNILDRWQLKAISLTTPYQIHCDMT